MGTIHVLQKKIFLLEIKNLSFNQMKCPHPIEPHQIQGLDFIHMYPVVQVAYNIPKCHKTGGLKTFALMIAPKKDLEKAT